MKFNWRMGIIGFGVCMMFAIAIVTLCALSHGRYALALVGGACLFFDGLILADLCSGED